MCGRARTTFQKKTAVLIAGMRLADLAAIRKYASLAECILLVELPLRFGMTGRDEARLNPKCKNSGGKHPQL